MTARSAPLTDTCVEGPRSHETVAVGAPAVYDKDGHKLRAEVGRNIAAGIFWAKTRYRSAPLSFEAGRLPRMMNIYLHPENLARCLTKPQIGKLPSRRPSPRTQTGAWAAV